jgi:hypothetical protein
MKKAPPRQHFFFLVWRHGWRQFFLEMSRRFV